jgi:hypothetical protein
MENRRGLCMDVDMDAADGKAERRNVLRMLRRMKKRHKMKPDTIGVDAGYDDGRFMYTLERMNIVPHVPLKNQNIVAEDDAGQARRRALRLSKTKGYRISQRIRKRVEEIIGWLKITAGQARARLVGRWKNLQQLLIAASAYNLLRITKLTATA